MSSIILASASPRRKRLLQQANIPCLCDAVATSEYFDPRLPLHEALQQVALQKAKAVQHKHLEAIIVGADTIVVMDNQVLQKPKDASEAKRMLEKLSGKTHFVYTAVALIKGEQVQTFYEKSEVTFYELETSLIDEYIASGSCFDKAGAYGIQDLGCLFVQSIVGDYNNIVGLPVAKLYRTLKTMIW